VRGLKEALARLGAWQGRLGPFRRSLWRGALRGGATFVILAGLYLFSLAMGEDHSPLLLLGWGAWASASVAAAGALEARWGQTAPWRTALACTALGWLACLGAVAQWGYMSSVDLGQAAGWQSALQALGEIRKDVWVALASISQLLGATVLVRKGRGMAALFYANVTISFVFFPIGLFVVCACEDWVWKTLEEAGEEAAPAEGAGFGSADPEGGVSG